MSNVLDSMLGGRWKTCAHLLPAYGAVYETKEEMLQDWKDGKDFRFISGPYCSVRDTELLQRNFRGIMLHDVRTHINALVWGEE